MAEAKLKVELPSMTLHPDSIIWVHVGYPDGTTQEFFCKLSELKIPGSTASIDYGYNCFGGVRFRKNKNDELYLFLGKNHYNRLYKSAQVLDIYHPQGMNGLPSSKVPYEKFRSVCFELRSRNENEFELGNFDYIRPTICATSNVFGVGTIKDRGIIQILSCMRLTGYYSSSGRGLLIVDPNEIGARPSHMSEVSPVKGGRETYVKGGKAKSHAESKGYTDALMSSWNRGASCYDRLDCSSSCFAVVTKDNTVIMPDLKGRALFGLTMQALIKRLEKAGITVSHDDVTDDIIRSANFLITAGTAAGVGLVDRVGWYNGEVVDYTNTDFFKVIENCFNGIVSDGIEHIPGLRSF